jgi:two-component system, NarL family, response regulator NreC
MIRVLLADDHEIVRAGLRMLIEAQPEMQVIAEAATGDELVARVRAELPDVAVVDLTMPGLGGLGAVRVLRDLEPVTRLVILTRHDDEAYVRELRAAGAVAYVLKHSASTELLQAIRIAAEGGTYFDPALRTIQGPAQTPEPLGITNREREVLRLTAIGHSNKEIASQLGISVKTVEVHKTNAMRKLQLLGRADVVRYAVVQGWMKDP